MLLEIGLNTLRSDEAWKRRLLRVADWLGEAIAHDGLGSLRERLEAASDLAKLGDLRPGVGVVEVQGVAVPHFAWCGLTGGGPFPDGKTKAFLMGGDSEAFGSSEVEFACTRIEQPFVIAKYPVTVAQYAAYLKAVRDERGADAVPEPENYGAIFETPNHPRVGVSWRDAMAFCEWLNHPEIFSTLGLPRDARIRLATDAEWELAARWNPENERRIFPWGKPAEGEDLESHLSAHCNWDKTGIGSTSAVGLFPNGNAACGAADMAGNVWEWCLTKWQPLKTPDDQKRYLDGKDSGDESGDENRVLRGGSWFDHVPRYLRSSSRGNLDPGNRNGYIGFRVVCVVLGSAGG